VRSVATSEELPQIVQPWRDRPAVEPVLVEAVTRARAVEAKSTSLLQRKYPVEDGDLGVTIDAARIFIIFA
jgi:hypothetical protein